MKSMKFLAIFAIIAVLLSACGGTATPAATDAAATEAAATEAAAAEDEWGYITIPAGESLKVGISTALAGAYAVYGEDMLNSVELAIANFGGSLKGFTLVSEGQDDSCDGAVGVTVAEKFSADPSILGVIGQCVLELLFPLLTSMQIIT